MILNHLKVTLRSFRRQTFFSSINLLGLAVGLAASWLIGVYVYYEHSYDRYLPAADRIFSVALDIKMGDQEAYTTNTPPPIGPRLASDFPEIEMAARTFSLGSVIVKRDIPGKEPLLFNEETAMAVDTSFLELFGFPLDAPNGNKALSKSGTMVMSQKAAKKYFGNVSPIGRALLLNDRLFTISGVADDLPTTSSVQFDFLVPMADFKVVENFSWSWIWLQVDTWVRLHEKPSPAALASLQAKFPKMIRAYAPAAYARIGQDLLKQFEKGDRLDVKLLPLTTLHLNSDGLVSRMRTLGDQDQVNMFAIIGALILILACVNFMNLSTARSVKRTREVGIRRAMGSKRSILVGQFLTESFFFSFLAMLLASMLASLSLPLFNQLTGLVFVPGDLFSPKTIGFVILLPVLAGILGGLYPAFYLSRNRAVNISKMAGTPVSGGHSGIRSALVVFQFAVSIALLVGSFIVYRQLNFALHYSPGLERENVLIVDNANNLGAFSSREFFKQQLLKLPEVVSVTNTTFLPSRGSFGDFYEPEQGSQKFATIESLPIGSFLTDADFTKTLGMKLVKGREFNSDAKGDSTSVILNESAVKAIGWADPIGKWIRYPGNNNQRFQVVGVVRDFHVDSFKSVIEPMAIFHVSSKTYQTWGASMGVRLRPGTEKTAISKAAALWKEMAPNAPFEHDFLDASFARLYKTESKTGSLLTVFTALAMFIGCLGLFALSAFTAEQRTKEIGIRKVLGASVVSLASLISRDFLKLVIVAILISAPVSWYFMDKWLQNFQYRSPISWWIFIIAGVISILVALLTVSFQSVKAALTSPVKSLKSE